MTIPELRQLNPRIPVRGGSWTAVGNWMGTLQNVSWSGDISSSSALMSLKAASPGALAVKLAVDLHQNNPRNIFTSGDQFCYGRVLGSIGPCLAGELAQVVPGRCLQNCANPIQGCCPFFSRGRRHSAVAGTRARCGTVGRNRGLARSMPLGSCYCCKGDTRSVESCFRCGPPGRPTDHPAQHRHRRLHSPERARNDRPLPTERLKLSQESTSALSTLPPETLFSSPKALSPCDSQYQQLSSTPKNVMLVKNSCVFTFPITAAEVTVIRRIRWRSRSMARRWPRKTTAVFGSMFQFPRNGLNAVVVRRASHKSWYANSAIRLPGRFRSPWMLPLVNWNNNGDLTPSTDVSDQLRTIGCKWARQHHHQRQRSEYYAPRDATAAG